MIAAASGATYNLAWVPLSLSELYFKDQIHPAIWIAFMLAIVWTGYSYAAIARQFLVYDPQQPWYVPGFYEVSYANSLGLMREFVEHLRISPLTCLGSVKQLCLKHKHDSGNSRPQFLDDR